MCSEKTARCDQEPASATTRVLLADDDLASSRFLGDGLRQMGVHVRTCQHGLQALEVARNEHFDLLLLDCRMPGAGAVEILTELRSDPAAACCASTAVASSAADESDEHRRTLLAAGFIGILRKPCTLAQVQQILTLIPSAGDEPLAWTLRRFERDLLDAIGYALPLQFDAHSGEPLEPAASYHYHVGDGAVRCAPGTSQALLGSDLLALSSDQPPDARGLLALRDMMRAVIRFHLGGGELRSWRVLAMTGSRR